MTVSKKALVAWSNVCLPGAAGGLNIVNLRIWNLAAILKLLWDINKKKDCLWVQWVHSNYIKKGDITQVQIPKTASWVVRKVLESRQQLITRLQSHGTIHQQLGNVQQRGKFSVHKMYVNLLPIHPKVTWKHLVLHPKIHPRYKFILWLAVQKRLATVERLQKFGINVPPDCAFCGQHLETFSHLFFECDVTRRTWRRLLQWMRYNRQIQDWENEVKWMSQAARRRGGQAEMTSCLFAMTMHKVWQARNFIRFQQKPFLSEVIIKDIVIHIHIRGRNSIAWRECLQRATQYPS